MQLLEQLRQITGETGCLTQASDTAPFLKEWRGRYQSDCLAVVLPESTDQVSEVVKCCSQSDIGIVPQSGNTGLVGGAVASGNQIILSLSRMNRVRHVDVADFSMTVEAGCTLKQIHQAAAEQGLMFPLRLVPDDLCQIGGNLATNAGGTNVLRYGNVRNQVLGVEAVLANGQIVDGLSALHKDNTGYALKDLIIGSEGTLAIITAATLRLFPEAENRVTALVGLESLSQGLALLGQVRTLSGDAVTACEVWPEFSRQIVKAHLPQTADPLGDDGDTSPWYALFEISLGQYGLSLNELQRLLADEGITRQLISAKAEDQAALWGIRKAIPAAQTLEGASIKHDVALPLSKIDAFIAQAQAEIVKILPQVRPCIFGHLGDGNLHFNLSQPVEMSADEFEEYRDQLSQCVHELVMAYQGSIAAEHGVGLAKKQAVHRYKADVESSLMTGLKQAFDPAQRLNPGKLL